jgi:predicted class III extradiol MEMO1 family dioxygenase
MEVNEMKQTCGICQEECFRTILSCKHHFHKYCLLKMDPDNLKCPLCRHPIDENMVMELFDNEDSQDETDDVYISDLEEECC